MSDQKKESVEKPFFAQFLEDQDLDQAQGGGKGGKFATLKYPSDADEYQTLKYPSDNDEGGYETP